jgi:hypothetical protein
MRFVRSGRAGKVEFLKEVGVKELRFSAERPGNPKADVEAPAV